MSETIFDLPMVFGERSSEELEDVVILPVAFNRSGTGTITSDVPWTEYEELVCGMGIETGGCYDSQIFPSDHIRENPTGFFQHLNYISGADNFVVYIRATSATTMEWTGTKNAVPSNTYPAYLIGRKKKYATTNLSVTLDVNSGNNIAVNTRYELPASSLPASFLDTSGNIKSNVEVRAEIFNNSGTGVAIWGEVNWVYDSGGRGVFAAIVGSVIAIQTGSIALCYDANLGGTPFSNTASITSTTCRIIATLAGEAYTVQTA